MKKWIALAALTSFVASGCAGTVAVVPTPTAPKPGVVAKPGEPAKLGDPVVNPVTGEVQPTKVLDIIGLPVEPLAGVAFKTISQADAKTLGGNLGGGASGGGNLAKAGAAAPTAAMADGAAMAAPGGMNESAGRGAAGGGGDASTAGGAYSGNSDSYYGYGYWFGGSEEMSLVSMTLGETDGSPTFTELAKKVGPIIKAWDPTARLQQTSGNLATDGTLFKPTPEPTTKPGDGGDELINLPACGAQSPQEQFWDGSAWRLIYRSTRRNEVLQIAGKADKTVIVRMRWAPLDLDLEEVQIDAGSAIAKVAAMIEDKAAQAEEEKTKLDYFLGIPFEQRTGMEWQDNRRTKLEVLYKVPKDAQWNASLDRVLGKLVWQLSFYNYYDNALQEAAQKEAVAAFKAKGFAAFGLTDPDDPNAPTPPVPSGCSPYGGRYYPYYGYPYGGGKPTPLPKPSPGQELYQPDPNVWVNNSSNAMVDARTGTVIRFSRPSKTINIPPKYIREIEKNVPSPSPTAMPVDLPNAGEIVAAGGDK